MCEYNKRMELLWTAFHSKNVWSRSIFFSEVCMEQTWGAQIFAGILTRDTLILKLRERDRYFRLN